MKGYLHEVLWHAVGFTVVIVLALLVAIATA